MLWQRLFLDTADAADHLSAAQAIAKGAIEGHTPERPVYWLHTSGAGLLSFHDTENKIYGERSEIIYDDLKDIQKILSFPDHAFHKQVDDTVFKAGTASPAVLKTAVIAPTTVYGMLHGMKLQERNSLLIPLKVKEMDPVTNEADRYTRCPNLSLNMPESQSSAKDKQSGPTSMFRA